MVAIFVVRSLWRSQRRGIVRGSLTGTLPESAIMADVWRPPAAGDSVLVFQAAYLDLLLSKEKSLEVRPYKLQSKYYFLGCRGRVLGVALFGQPELVADAERWRFLAPEHHVSTADPMYKRTWVHRVMRIAPAPHPLRYVHPQGAIGSFRWR